jgi:hypothetical protein
MNLAYDSDRVQDMIPQNMQHWQIALKQRNLRNSTCRQTSQKHPKASPKPLSEKGLSYAVRRGRRGVILTPRTERHRKIEMMASWSATQFTPSACAPVLSHFP